MRVERAANNDHDTVALKARCIQRGIVHLKDVEVEVEVEVVVVVVVYTTNIGK